MPCKMHISILYRKWNSSLHVFSEIHFYSMPNPCRSVTLWRGWRKWDGGEKNCEQFGCNLAWAGHVDFTRDVVNIYFVFSKVKTHHEQ